jgi:hypothetical protein
MQIAQLEPRHLDRAQTESREQHQDRQVAHAHDRRAVTRPEQQLDLRPGHHLRDAGVAPAADRRNALRQSRIREAARAQEPQQRAQMIGVAVKRPRFHARALAEQEPGHI